jgi:hypothetical protein
MIDPQRSIAQRAMIEAFTFPHPKEYLHATESTS